MSAFRRSELRNVLLSRCPEDAFDALAPDLESVTFDMGAPLVLPDQPIDAVYFAESGLASVTMTADPRKVEVGLVGKDGMVGLPVVLQADGTPTHTFVQMPGTFLRLPAARLRRVMEASPDFTRLLLRYAQAYHVQVASTAMANVGFSVDQRLARWLLMVHDRAEGDDLPLTHDFISMMLGVRRPGVTVATHVLEGDHMIRASRAKIAVLDRRKLRAFASGGYGRAEDEYERLIGAALSRPDGAPQVAMGAGAAARVGA